MTEDLPNCVLCRMNLKDARLGRFLCWLWFGHKWDKTKNRHMASRTMNTCEICGAYEAGPD